MSRSTINYLAALGLIGGIGAFGSLYSCKTERVPAEVPVMEGDMEGEVEAGEAGRDLGTGSIDAFLETPGTPENARHDAGTAAAGKSEPGTMFGFLSRHAPAAGTATGTTGPPASKIRVTGTYCPGLDNCDGLAQFLENLYSRDFLCRLLQETGGIGYFNGSREVAKDVACRTVLGNMYTALSLPFWHGFGCPEDAPAYQQAQKRFIEQNIPQCTKMDSPGEYTIFVCDSTGGK